ncbi:helix-turn-helix domain-containing protein [Plantactinospora sp. BB1]|uniref:winged helix-turn-helix transcriptional regulator n=1 Tax=Plantactinospora sp. BB1 TaxID=2071627 RepID=UPI000D15880B|nr:helix-turn-helix domain-containing protein [Plantactinospora sp. BB1]AVT39873.1 transcriptional regulator [Plantactinospora sp. BB1]
MPPPAPEPPGPERCAPADAALTRAFSVLGKRWTASVLGSLKSGPAGFREISRAVGRVSDSVLSDRLAELTEHGLVVRTVREGPPIAVSYRLTERGQALMPALEQIARWATEHLPADDDART